MKGELAKNSKVIREMHSSPGAIDPVLGSSRSRTGTLQTPRMTVLEICTGAGGQAAGLEGAGFELAAAVEIDPHACNTLRCNRPSWNVIENSIANVDGSDYREVDLLAGGVPCPPFSIAGKQLGQHDERNMFPQALRIIAEAKPSAVLLENVPGFASAKFDDYRRRLLLDLKRIGYESDWTVLNASWFGVPQLRPRFVLVAFRGTFPESFCWPDKNGRVPPTVGEALLDLMSLGGWKGARNWSKQACDIAPTLVGGSKKHGGPDLGPTRARKQWARLAVDGLGIADEPPGLDKPDSHKPRLTLRMAARLQGFSDSWSFSGGKTAAYRQIGNAFPPPVAQIIGRAIHKALSDKTSCSRRKQLRLFAAAG